MSNFSFILRKREKIYIYVNLKVQVFEWIVYWSSIRIFGILSVQERVICDVISGGNTGLERSIDFGHVIVYTMFYDTIFSRYTNVSYDYL